MSARRMAGRRSMVLVAALAFLTVLLALGAVVLDLASTDRISTLRMANAGQAQLAAQAAAEGALSYLDEHAGDDPAALAAAIGARGPETAVGSRSGVLDRACYQWELAPGAPDDDGAPTVTVRALAHSPGNLDGAGCARAPQAPEVSVQRLELGARLGAGDSAWAVTSRTIATAADGS